MFHEIFATVSGFAQIERPTSSRYDIQLFEVWPKGQMTSEGIVIIPDSLVLKNTPPGRRKLVIFGWENIVKILFFEKDDAARTHSDLNRIANENFPDATFSLHGAIIPIQVEDDVATRNHKLIIYQSPNKSKPDAASKNVQLIEELLTALNAQSWEVQLVPLNESNNDWAPPPEVVASYEL